MYIWYFHISYVHFPLFFAFHHMSTVWLFACFLLITKVPLFLSHRSLQKSAEQVHPSLWGPVLRHRACAQQAPEGQEGALTWRQVPSFRLSCPWKVWQFFQILIFLMLYFPVCFSYDCIVYDWNTSCRRDLQCDWRQFTLKTYSILMNSWIWGEASHWVLLRVDLKSWPSFCLVWSLKWGYQIFFANICNGGKIFTID